MLLLEEKEGHYIDMITVVWSVNSLDDIFISNGRQVNKRENEDR